MIPSMSVLQYTCVLINKGNYRKAEKILLKNLENELAKELQDNNQVYIKILRLYLGVMYDLKDNREKAIDYYKEIINIWGHGITFTKKAEKGLNEPLKVNDLRLHFLW